MREQKERWMELCAQAAEEQDPVRLRALIEEINRLLEMKNNRLSGENREASTKEKSGAFGGRQ
jgi:hypothetical protein